MLRPPSGNPAPTPSPANPISRYRRHPRQSLVDLPVCTRPLTSPFRSSPSCGHHRIRTNNTLWNGVCKAHESLNNRTVVSKERCEHDSAEKWFNDSNVNVSENRNLTVEDCRFIDILYCQDTHAEPAVGDPPFYLHRRSLLQENTTGILARETLKHLQRPVEPAGARMDAYESDSEDFRGVIDDLTVENQKLKQKLRAYETIHCAQLQPDQLFEVRVHGLSILEKRNLEGTLRRFAATLDKAQLKPPSLPTEPQVTATGLRQPVDPVPSGYSACNSRPPDSGYASMSASGKASIPQSRHIEALKPSRSTLSNKQNIDSYLQHIPEGFLPRHMPLMTERSQAKLIVKKLEQVFTGKRAASEKHSHSLQQEEVSQSAAKADRSAVEARGQTAHVEGRREAKMLPSGSRVSGDATNGPQLPPLLRHTTNGNESNTGVRDFSDNGTPGQRPTRPIDLDPHRAQDYAENMAYIRHLDVASPKPDVDSALENGSRWAYLNLLFGMAQLHTINVTLEFVRKAVVEMSEKLELSKDGSKVRWRGGAARTQMSNDGRSSFGHEDEAAADDHLAVGKLRSAYSKPTTDTQSGNDRVLRSLCNKSNDESEFANSRRRLVLGRIKPDIQRGYQSVFRHRSGSQHEQRYPSIGSNSSISSAFAEEGFGSALGPSQRTDEGPIIFYSGVSFCIDLSGDVCDVAQDALENTTHSQGVLGCCAEEANIYKHWTDSKGLLNTSCSSDSDLRSHEDSPGDLEIQGLELPITVDHNDIHHGLAPFVLEASGIGGVRPADNFTIDVQIRRVLVHCSYSECYRHSSWKMNNKYLVSSHDSRHSFVRRRGPTSTINIRASQDRIASEVVTAKITNLIPSSLPPPSYAFAPLSSSIGASESNDDKANCEDEVDRAASLSVDSCGMSTESPLNSHESAPPNSLYNAPSDSIESTYGDSDDSSIDLLAHARRLDPDSVAACEREFDINDSTSVQEEVLHDSMAATAGAGTWSAESELESYGSNPSNSNDTSRAGSTPTDSHHLSTFKRPHDMDQYTPSHSKRLRVL